MKRADVHVGERTGFGDRCACGTRCRFVATTMVARPVRPVFAAMAAAISGLSMPICSARSPSRTPLIVTASGSTPTLDFRRNRRISP